MMKNLSGHPGRLVGQQEHDNAFAMSAAEPIFFKGCRSAFACLFSSVLSKLPASGVSVIEGAIQFTLILGANSAANALVSPSIAPLEAAIIEW